MKTSITSIEELKYLPSSVSTQFQLQLSLNSISTQLNLYSNYGTWHYSAHLVIVVVVLYVVVLIIVVLIVVVDPTNIEMKFGQHWVSYGWGIAEKVFVVVLVVGGELQSFSCQTQLLLCYVGDELSCGWVGVLPIWNACKYVILILE